MKLSEIAQALSAELEGDPELEIEALEPLDSAGPTSLSFLANPRYLPQLASTAAAAVILGPGIESPGPAVLRVPDAYLAFARALSLFADVARPAVGVDPAASVAASAVVGAGARIAPGAVVGDGARLGAGATLFPGVVVYPRVTIGDDFTAHANCVLREGTVVGDRVTLGPGVAIGGDGFGFIPLPDGGVFKIPQIGSVEIGDDVEIGANSTIDRATIGKTIIESGAKLDNLVMIAHGCRVGAQALVAAQTGLAGSTVVGARAQLGGQVGAAGHLTIGEGVRVAAQSGVPNDVPAGAEIGGYPAMDATLWRRVSAATRRLPELVRRVRRLEKALGGPAKPREQL